MIPVDTIKTVASISSGTLARLFGVDRYDDIDQRLARWIEWLSRGGQEYATWQDAWAAYREASKE